MTYGVFLFFLAIVVIMTIFVIFCVPETKGVPVEEVDVLLMSKHWLWSRVMAGPGLPVNEDEVIQQGGAASVEKPVL
jgi:hypothetical protein